MVSFIQLPYNASIIAHENMSIYAYVGLYEALSKLAIAYLIKISPIDKLIFYGFLLMANSLLIQTFYRVYVHKHYEECRFSLVKDKKLYKQILSYCGWDLIGNLSVACQGQGVNLLLNVFFGPVVNAARAIVFQIQGAVMQFVNNFMTAVRPQVIKNYAEGNINRMYTMTFYTAKFSYILMLALVLPICFEIRFILKIWLGDSVPDNTALFAIIVLATYTLRSFHTAALMPYHAIGKIRTGNLTIGTLMIATLPIGYLLFKFGFPAYSIFLVILVVEIICIFAMYWLIHKYEYFPYIHLFTKILLPSALVTIISIIPATIIYMQMTEGLWRLIILTCATEVALLLSALYFGLNKQERLQTIKSVKNNLKIK